MTRVPSSPVALLDQLDELRAKATPGPWAKHPNADDTVVGAYAEGGEDGPEYLNVADCRGEWPCARADQEAADAALIVAAVNAVGPLGDAVRAVESIARVWAACADTWQENADLAKSPEMREACLVEMRDYRDRARVLTAAITAALSVTP